VTQQDQDAVIGRTIRELRDVREKLATLRSAARSMADSFDTVAHHFRNEPQFLRFDGEITDSRFVKIPDPHRHPDVAPHIPKKTELDVNCVITLVAEIRRDLVEEERLVKGLREIGFKAPE
jgi:hypothetical protein